MKIFAVLHGQTDMETEGRLQGKGDLPLNDAGRAQAAELGQALQSRGVDMIMYSPQQRGAQTAEIIAGYLGVEANRMSKGVKLFERDFGDLEGEPISGVDIYALSSWTGNAATPNGETIRETAVRVISYMNNMVKLLFKGKTVLLIVSDQVLRVLFWYFNGIPEVGKETEAETEYGVVYEFDSETIQQEMLDSQYIISRANPTGKDGKGNADRVLSQGEIDVLITEIENAPV